MVYPYLFLILELTVDLHSDSLASSISTANQTVSTVQFLTWNPHINGLCDSLKEGDYVCARYAIFPYQRRPPHSSIALTDYNSAPGGSYIPPPPPPGSANASAQARGGGDGSTNPATNSTGTSTNATASAIPSSATLPPSSTVSTPITSASAPPSPTQTGLSPHCTKYAQAKRGDYCSKFAQDNGVSADQLYTWNVALGNGGSGCDKQFWTGYWYCVGASG